LRYHKSLQKHYDLSEKDVENLLYLQPIMANYKNDFIKDYYNAITNKFSLSDKQHDVLNGNKDKLGQWFDRLFDGNPNNNYYNFLYSQGVGIQKYNFEPDYLTAMISFARLWIHERIFQIIDDDIKRKSILISMHKLLDINNEVMMGAFYDKIVSKYTSVFSARKLVVDISEKFSLLMHMILVLILIGLTSVSVYIFAQDIVHLMQGNAEAMLITALGSLLIIWVLVELLHTEIQIIRGGKFKTSVFVSVALIAFIRDLLIITLKHEKESVVQYGFILGSILILGLIFWLIVNTENKN